MRAGVVVVAHVALTCADGHAVERHPKAVRGDSSRHMGGLVEQYKDRHGSAERAQCADEHSDDVLRSSCNCPLRRPPCQSCPQGQK